MKIMGIDYGDARTGVAISDLLCTLVGSATVVPSRNTEKAIADIVRLAQENQVGEIVVGRPRTWTAPRASGRSCVGNLRTGSGWPPACP